MGWETRGGRQYYYRTFRRPDGKVARTYLGTGAKAEAAAAAIAKAKAEDRQAQTLVARMTTQQVGLDAQADDVDRAIADVLNGELLAAGFYLHAGVWRHKRETKH